MDIEMNYDEALDIIKREGEDGFFNHIDKMYPEFRLFKMSTDWIESQDYICKFKGGRGDIIINWT